MSELHQKITLVRSSINQAVLGQEDLIDEVLSSLIAGGHHLLTGVPGLAKTMLVKTISQTMGLEFSRIQFTPDLMPFDITGSEIFVEQKRFEFLKGPIFSELILADEINRASPRTQSALLEAMQEKSVTVAGQNYPLPNPFFVLATQNPIESEGTYPLPEAQLDRFLSMSVVGYPAVESEIEVYRRTGGTVEVEKSLSKEDLLEVQREAAALPVPERILELVAYFVRSTRPDDPTALEEVKQSLVYGAGTRAGMAIVQLAKAMSYLRGYPEVKWSSIQRVIPQAIRHRVIFRPDFQYQGQDPEGALRSWVEAFEKAHRARLEEMVA